jgi:hypothetical protein
MLTRFVAGVAGLEGERQEAKVRKKRPLRKCGIGFACPLPPARRLPRRDKTAGQDSGTRQRDKAAGHGGVWNWECRQVPGFRAAVVGGQLLLSGCTAFNYWEGWRRLAQLGKAFFGERRKASPAPAHQGIRGWGVPVRDAEGGIGDGWGCFGRECRSGCVWASPASDLGCLLQALTRLSMGVILSDLR